MPAADMVLEKLKAAGIRPAQLRKALGVDRSTASLMLSGKRGIKGLIRPDIRQYDLRHAFGTMAALVTKDDTAVQKLMRHSDPRQTALYMKAAADPRVVAAIAKMAEALKIQPADPEPVKAAPTLETKSNATVH